MYTGLWFRLQHRQPMLGCQQPTASIQQKQQLSYTYFHPFENPPIEPKPTISFIYIIYKVNKESTWKDIK
jgi:hypothetical protein